MKDFKTRLKEAADTLSFTDFPIQVILETVSSCNFKCPACPTAMLNRKRGRMPFELFKKIVDEIAREDKETELYPAYMGEPLLYKSLFEGIRYAKDIGLKKVFLNTNAQLLDNDTCSRLLDSGVDRVIVSFDGISKEIFEARRVGGDFDVVMKNTINLIRRAKQNASSPSVWVQMIIDQGNKHEEESFKHFWGVKHGAVVKIRPQMNWGRRIGENDMTKIELERIPCPWVMRQIVFTVEGEAALCDADHEAQYNLGNIKELSIREIWNTSFKEMRIRQMNYDFQHPLCKNCDDWKAGKSEIFYPD